MYDKSDLLSVTADLVSAYVGNNTVRLAELPELIAAVHASLAGVGEPKPIEEPVDLKPAVSIKKSITPDYLICLDDGKQFRSLKRHLSQLGMTPDQYRAKWGLPDDYPMVAPGYSAQRSEMAKAFGLGNNRKAPTTQADNLMDTTALSPVEPEAATLAPVVEERQLEPIEDAPVEAEVVEEKPGRRRGRPAKEV